MIVEFSTANYGSINNIQTISFRATDIISENSEVSTKNIVNINNDKLLKIVGIYGANASGKTTLLKAVSFFKEMIISSVESEGYTKYGFNPFKQNTQNLEKPSYFQIILIIEGNKYRYGFTINKSGDIESEWLFGYHGE